MTEYAIAKDLQKVSEFVRRYGKPYESQNDNYKKEPFASDVRAGKTSRVYNAHSYHTKVPPKGIESFIKHYTEPGDLVLDPFCGSGMTGVAALTFNRIPILVELSPIATFITANYCISVDLDEFIRLAEDLQARAKPLADWLYETRCRKCGKTSITEYVIWSDEFQCPRCDARFLLWDVAVDKLGKVSREFFCPTCGRELRKTNCKRVNSKPVKVNYNCPRCKRQEANMSEFDLAKLAEIERRWTRIYSDDLPPDTKDSFWPVDENLKPLWFPSNRMPDGDEARRNDKIGITHVNHFFSTRNLWFLAWLWNQIPKMTKNDIMKNKLRFVFTSVLTISSKMGRYGKRTGNVSGTLYIPSLIKEMNVSRFVKRKIWGPKGVYPAFKELWNLIGREQRFIVLTQSATDLSNIPSDSIDYVFTDPPFGGNLMYSDLNFLWEAWLGQFTDIEEEAIISRKQGKGVKEYKQLMTESFHEVYRILKPGRWMTMVFHNSKGEVWQSIQEGLAEAGFAIGMIGTFDKKQRSFKQVTSSGAVGYDVVVNCYKPKATVKNGIQGKTTEEAIIGFIADKLREPPSTPSDERTDRKLHSKTIGFFMQQNKPLKKLSHEDFQKILKRNFREIDGYWYLPYQRPKTIGQKRLFGYITNEAEAIEWLEPFLRKTPHKYGDIVPDFFKALGPNQLKKDLQQILEENFVEENGVWRNATTAEKERLIRKVTDKTARQIDQFLKGTIEYTPTNTELCKWIEFCYANGLYPEGAKLFQHINENAIDPELFKKTKKVAEICKIKSWR